MAHSYHRKFLILTTFTLSNLFLTDRAYTTPAIFVDMHNGLVPPDHPVVGGDDVNGTILRQCLDLNFIH